MKYYRIVHVSSVTHLSTHCTTLTRLFNENIDCMCMHTVYLTLSRQNTAHFSSNLRVYVRPVLVRGSTSLPFQVFHFYSAHVFFLWILEGSAWVMWMLASLPDWLPVHKLATNFHHISMLQSPQLNQVKYHSLPNWPSLPSRLLKLNNSGPLLWCMFETGSKECSFLVPGIVREFWKRFSRSLW